MRKQVLFGAALLALGTAVVSCSKDEVVIDNTPGVETPAEDGVQELILNMNSAGDGLTTRGGRPLYSSEAAQEIDKVVIKIIDRSGSGDTNKKEVRSITINNWQEVSKQYTVGGHGRMYTFKLSKDQKVPKGTYEIYAIGYTSTDSSYDFENYENLDVTTEFGYQTQTLTSTTDPEAEEVFAGSIYRITVDADGNFALTDNPENNVLTLHRQVAGVIGYYSNIPTLKAGAPINDYVSAAYNYDEYVEGLKLRLVSSNASNKIVFAGFNSKFTETGEDYMYVVNGSNTGDLTTNDIKFEDGTEAYSFYEIELAKWFITGDFNNDGLLDVNDNRDPEGNRLDNWISPYSSIENLEFEEGSVFAGKFVIPFQKVKNSPKTLELQLVAENALRHNEGGEVYAAGSIIRSWTINLSSTDPQVVGSNGATKVHARTVSETTGELAVMNPDLEESANSYSIVRNHLYTVGTKGTNDYNPDTDEPQDLSKGQELILKVNDNWELIHKMEVE